MAKRKPLSRRARLDALRPMLVLRQRQERQLEARLARVIAATVAAAAARYPASLTALMRRQVRDLMTALEPSVIVSVTSAGKLSLDRVPKTAAQERLLIDSAARLDARMVAAARARAADKVTNIAETTRARIAGAIERGVARGDAPGQIQKAIREEVGGMTAARARTIARTETATAMATGEAESIAHMEKVLDMPMTKTWAATSDDRTRETHADADGQTVKNSEQFKVGKAMLDFPHDPNGPPEEVINCRCACLYLPA